MCSLGGIFRFGFTQIGHELLGNLLLLLLAECSKVLERILQHHHLIFLAQFVQNLGERMDSLVTVGLRRQDCDCLGVTRRSLGVVALGVIDIAGLQEHGSFVHAVLLALLDSEFIVLEGVRRIALHHVDVTYCAV